MTTMTHKLTQREFQVMQLASEGFTRAEIAEMMGISIDGVKQHLRRIYNRWTANNITHAVAIAVHEGICTP